MTRDQMLAHLRAADAVGREAAAHGHHPFGAVLVGPDDRILMRQGNINTVRHAETELARRAADTSPADHLWRCTLVTTFEPCAMCAGTLYWANIGRLVYGVEENKLLGLTGDLASARDLPGIEGRPAQNPTMSLSARAVLASGQKRHEVHGPFPEIEDALIAPHRDFWRRNPRRRP
jgi:tRNA(Arg) A34 adenosine deaminase TadA